MDITMKNEGYGVPPLKKEDPGTLGGWPVAPFADRAEF
jgi:hypothetical protein